MPLATALRSLVEVNQIHWPLDIYVLSESFHDESKSKVSGSLPVGSASVRWIQVDLTEFRHFATLPHITPMTYARFLIPTIFPEFVERVLYLDADILVLDDLTCMWETDLGGCVLGAVVDQLDTHMKAGSPVANGLPHVRNYFNAGVLVIDICRWKEERVSEKGIAYLAHYPETPYADQDALNVACDGVWKRLNSRWNVQDHSTRSIGMIPGERGPGIIHFVTSNKPWIARCVNPNAESYDSYRRRTRFGRDVGERLTDTAIIALFRVKAVLRRCTLLHAIWIWCDYHCFRKFRNTILQRGTRLCHEARRNV